MKKQFFLLTLIIFGAVYFPSGKDNGVNACDKNCHTACCVPQKSKIKEISFDYDEEEFDQFKIFPIPFINI